MSGADVPEHNGACSHWRTATESMSWPRPDVAEWCFDCRVLVSLGRMEPCDFVRDLLDDCLSSFHGPDGFDRVAAIDFLLSPSSGLRIEAIT